MAEHRNDNEQNESITEAPIVLDRSRMPSSPHNAHDIVLPPSRMKLRFLGAAMLVIVSAAAGFGGGWLGARDKAPSPQQQQIVLRSQGQLISTIASRVGPSVVSVEVTTQSAPTDSFFGFQGSREQRGAGTGIILDKNGLIMTNRHVVPVGTSRVDVTLSDGTTFENVQVIGRTSESDPLDVAFIKINDTKGKVLTPATLGDSAKVSIGESVIAIGNALGQFQNTVTSGIISGHGRNIQAGDESGNSAESLQNLFQTDAAINQGNSGGPLVNLEGQVIGINTAVAATGQSIGFAIPINDVKGMVATVMEKGKLERPYLGVVYLPVTADLAKRYSLGVNDGAYIAPDAIVGQDPIVNGGPADKAGIKEGDIIIKVNDEKVDASHSLTSLLGKHTVGKKVTLTIVRDGKERPIEVTLEASPQN